MRAGSGQSPCSCLHCGDTGTCSLARGAVTCLLPALGLPTQSCSSLTRRLRTSGTAEPWVTRLMPCPRFIPAIRATLTLCLRGGLLSPLWDCISALDLSLFSNSFVPSSVPPSPTSLHVSRNLKPGKRKKQVAQMITYQKQPKSPKQSSPGGGGGPLFVQSAQSAHLRASALSGVDTLQSQLHSGTCITKKKSNNVQASMTPPGPLGLTREGQMCP